MAPKFDPVLETEMEKINTPPLPERLPPRPHKQLSQAKFAGEGYNPFSAQGGWPTSRPPKMQSTAMVRRRADLEMLRHGHIYDLDPFVCVGPNTDNTEWEAKRKAMRQEVYNMNYKFVGSPESFLRVTIESEIRIENIKDLAHNYYREGRRLKALSPPEETAAEKAARELQARAYIAKGERAALVLEHWADQQLQDAIAQLSKLNADPKASKAKKQAQTLDVEWARGYAQPYLNDLRAVFVAADHGLPLEKTLFGWRGYESRCDFYDQVFDTKDRIFSAYGCFEACNHFAANMKKGKARTLLMNKLYVACEQLWRHVVSPRIRMWNILCLSDPVLRLSINIKTDVPAIYAALASLDITAGFDKRTFGGVEVIKVPLAR
ncbi:hypothetical protein P153DRAFT_434973 [Dothidotthia symphoricarpi CBS 119687]|uniref:Uncharacterized protein n=1 Tax=Dothidotthia symphoricarpi CBS 119687 TaxID=1392245 RepID=A0A6A6A0Q3_9PLEO|nr:uncharacterized protein P153DRAFT_434973 [Dothidotthia symphoricarpi CBS 119687]KAF2124734.1 hypothetical protein P153DRAFT_434973 [Dothidotthia symphoricarpi CBS 119687]